MRQVASNKTPAVIEAVRDALKATLGGPLAGAATWKPLTTQRAGFAAALLEILQAHPKERPALEVTYAKHRHFLVADRDRAR